MLIQEEPLNVKKFEVMLYDVGVDAQAKVRSLFNYMQSAADSHSKTLGTSLSDISADNLTWVYSRFYAEIERFPQLYEEISCDTWRPCLSGNYACREFIIKDSTGGSILRATSTLALIDRDARKPVRIGADMLSSFEPERERAIEYPFPMIEIPSEIDYITDIKVRSEDMDVNNHMNNASFAQFFYESIYEKFGDSLCLQSMDINFRAEGSCGSIISCSVSSSEQEDGIFYHRMTMAETGRVLALGETRWKERVK